MVARFQVAPKDTHIKDVKRIFWYSKATMDFGLWYPKSDNFNLIACTNANRVKCIEDWKSISGGALFHGDSLVLWLSKKRDSVSLSTIEAEYITTISCCTQFLLINHNLKEMKVEFEETISILYDNTNAISISQRI